MRHVDTASTDQSIRVWAYDADGAAITGEAYNSAGIAASVVVRSAGRIVSTTALTLVARTSVGIHRDSAFTEVGSGEYVIDLPDNYFATADREISVTLTSTAISGGYVLSESLGVSAALATKEVVDSIAVALAGGSPVEPTGATVFELLEQIQTDVGDVTGNIIIDTNGVNAIVNALLAQGPTLYTALTADETTLRIADEYVQEFTGLGDLSGRDNIAFALKTRKTDADTAALIYLTETGGLTRVNGAAYATTANGSITVDNEVAGDITVRISSAVTAGLTVGKRQDAVKILVTGGNDITKRQGITNVIDGTVAALG